jgi:hypothetical protein
MTKLLKKSGAIKILVVILAKLRSYEPVSYFHIFLLKKGGFVAKGTAFFFY